jgi:hypothetical protein
MANILADSRKFAGSFKGIICDDISEFESYMPSHAVGLSVGRVWSWLVAVCSTFLSFGTNSAQILR